MYKNIGGKIKTLARVIFASEAIAAFIAAIAIMVSDEDLIPYGLIVLVVGPLVAWVSSWLLYGFGEIIDKLCAIEYNTGVMLKPSELKKLKKQHEAEVKGAEVARKKAAAQKVAEAEEAKVTHKKAEAGEEDLVSVVCPKCGEDLYFGKDLAEVECPYCGCHIDLE